MQLEDLILSTAVTKEGKSNSESLPSVNTTHVTEFSKQPSKKAKSSFAWFQIQNIGGNKAKSETKSVVLKSLKQRTNDEIKRYNAKCIYFTLDSEENNEHMPFGIIAFINLFSFVEAIASLMGFFNGVRSLFFGRINTVVTNCILICGRYKSPAKIQISSLLVVKNGLTSHVEACDKIFTLVKILSASFWQPLYLVPGDICTLHPSYAYGINLSITHVCLAFSLIK
ncbi:hypothetical protein HELRODRAFT_165481 [Helobdella robusta]|uniref:Uncharacterized protein n=1 Tax=Helobdella robusta TaxID=6412 RepID=T1EWW0_HELRO|nr:hypothetical protein HELRODRAFT_165481 [Helobdella robusta]ESN91447.1 hypothetical protein HELRODRAFT_165481 [Helobdella robusta]